MNPYPISAARFLAVAVLLLVGMFELFGFAGLFLWIAAVLLLRPLAKLPRLNPVPGIVASSRDRSRDGFSPLPPVPPKP